ncbi:MAG: hypothetical protein OSA78_00175 [Flavobacteriales bacterium]|nr:hypothetical protein [Flavobacteriales bacterium]
MSELSDMVKRLGFTHLWIAVAAGSSAAGSLIAFSEHESVQSTDWSFLWAISAFTGWVYTFQRWMKSTRNPEQMPASRLDFMRKQGGRLGVFWTLLTIWAAARWLFEAGTPFAHLLTRQWPLMLLAAVMSIGYAFNPIGSRRGWRERPHLKLPTIALSWTLATIVFPSSHLGLSWWDPENTHLWGIAISQALFVAGITVPFDVRDVRLDPHEFQTWPQRWGASSSIRIALFLLAISASGFVVFDLNWGRAAVAILALPVVAWTIRPRKEAAYSILLDGLLILQGSAVFWFSTLN